MRYKFLEEISAEWSADISTDSQVCGIHALGAFFFSHGLYHLHWDHTHGFSFILLWFHMNKPKTSNELDEEYGP